MNLTTIPTSLSKVLILEPKVFGDARGFFSESFNTKSFKVATSCQRAFVWDNHSHSAHKVLRGLHYQVMRPQGKLVRVITGKVLNVAVDLRKSSPNFGKRTGTVLSAENKRRLWVPEGFAHGFVVLSDSAEFPYKATDYWYPECERSVLWNGSDTGIEWSFRGKPPLAAKGTATKRLVDADSYG